MQFITCPSITVSVSRPDMSDPWRYRVCCTGKRRRTTQWNGKRLFSLASEQALLCLPDTYFLYYVLSRFIEVSSYWQSNFQTATKQRAMKTCRLSHHMKVSGMSASDFLFGLNFHTYAEQFPGLISLSALNNSVRFVWLQSACFELLQSPLQIPLRCLGLWLRIC